MTNGKPTRSKTFATALASIAVLAGFISSSTAHTAPACSALRWTTLGTAGGPQPSNDRSEPANLLQAGEELILVDVGDGAVVQLTKLGMDLANVRTVFISHHHVDHTGGLTAVIGVRWMTRGPGTLTVYGPVGTNELVDGIIASLGPQSRIEVGGNAALPPPSTGVKVVELASADTVHLGTLRVTVAENTHFALHDHKGGTSAETPRSLSYRFQLGDRTITYTGDTGPSEAVKRLAAGTSMLVSEIVDLPRMVDHLRLSRPDMDPEFLESVEQHLAKHHLTPSEVGALASGAGAERLVVTHFAVPPGPLGNSLPRMREDIGRRYSGSVDFASDLSHFDAACAPPRNKAPAKIR